MAKGISIETRKLIEDLYLKNLAIKKIAKQAKVSYLTAYRYIKVKQRGFSSLLEYKNYLAQQKGFSSYKEYTRHLIKQRGFSSLTDYENYLIKQRGFTSYTEYRKDLAKRRGFASLTDYENYLAQQKGFASQLDYRKNSAKKRQQRPGNKALSSLIKKNLNCLGKNQSWLAKELGVTRQTVSLYSQGKYIPKKEVLKRLYLIFNLSAETLEDLL